MGKYIIYYIFPKTSKIPFFPKQVKYQRYNILLKQYSNI